MFSGNGTCDALRMESETNMHTSEEISADCTPTKKLEGLVFDIQGHSVHDGPGTRTTVFMSGCPLHCIWCCNPEGLFRQPVIMYRETKCKCCGRCIKSCPYDAVSVSKEGKLVFNREMCDKCKTYDCIETCYNEAIELSGKYYSTDELMRLFQRDRQFWGGSGGVTFSGGEPLMQRDFMLAILKECKKSYIHTCIETTSNLPSEYFMQVIQYVDWVFTDIKHMDPQKHLEITGVNNQLILKNIRLLAEADWNGFIVPRIPVIPGINDSDENIRATAKFVKDIGLEVINILPFHRLGESKYRQVGQVYKFAEQKPPADSHMRHLKRIIENEGLVCFIGYETPF